MVWVCMYEVMRIEVGMSWVDIRADSKVDIGVEATMLVLVVSIGRHLGLIIWLCLAEGSNCFAGFSRLGECGRFLGRSWRPTLLLTYLGSICSKVLLALISRPGALAVFCLHVPISG
jgi:hypothetical protein